MATPQTAGGRRAFMLSAWAVVVVGGSPGAFAGGQPGVISAKDADFIFRIATPRDLPLGTFFRGVVVGAPGACADHPDFVLSSDQHVESGPILPGRVSRFTGFGQSPVWTAVGSSNIERYGRSLAFVADQTGDGLHDLAVGAFADGRVFIIRGDNGAPLQTITTAPIEFGSFGYSMTTIRDADGRERLIVASPAIGRAWGYTLSDTADATLYQLESGPFPSLGNWITNIGDVNADGVDDFAATEPDRSVTAFVFCGATGSVLYLTGARQLSTEMSVARGGDYNRDGVDDLIITGAGLVRVISGATGQPLGSWATEESDRQRSVIAVGDVTGDNVVDFVVSEPGLPFEKNTGRAALYSGRTRQPLLHYEGEQPFDRFGHSMSVIGAEPGKPAALLVRAFRSGGDETTDGAYVYMFRFPPPCPGDANFDRVIDAQDIALVLQQYGQTGHTLGADVNGDGVVDFQDLGLVLGAFGTACD